jgi:hypothetical protein
MDIIDRVPQHKWFVKTTALSSPLICRESNPKHCEVAASVVLFNFNTYFNDSRFTAFQKCDIQDFFPINFISNALDFTILIILLNSRVYQTGAAEGSKN